MTLHKTPRRTRHPFRIGTEFVTQAGMTIWIVDAAPDDPYGSSTAFLAELQTLALCEVCDAPCTDLYEHIHPQTDSGWGPSVARLRIDRKSWEAYSLAIRRESSRRASYGRHLRKRAAGLEPTEEELDDLWVTQRARCYYCYKVIKDGKFHLDHYLPLVLGGTNDIHNRVIACPSCNRRKHNLAGDQFCTLANEHMHPNTLLAQAVMWEEVRALRNRLSLRCAHR